MDATPFSTDEFRILGVNFFVTAYCSIGFGAEAHPLTLLGGFRINQLPFIASSRLSGLADWGEVHKFLGDVIMWLAGIHALAAMYHHIKLKDGVLTSMLP